MCLVTVSAISYVVDTSLLIAYTVFAARCEEVVMEEQITLQIAAMERLIVVVVILLLAGGVGYAVRSRKQNEVDTYILKALSFSMSVLAVIPSIKFIVSINGPVSPAVGIGILTFPVLLAWLILYTMLRRISGIDTPEYRPVE
jgi:nitrogen fixation/metabolism regulation signal transduction histidine kinase